MGKKKALVLFMCVFSLHYYCTLCMYCCVEEEECLGDKEECRATFPTPGALTMCIRGDRTKVDRREEKLYPHAYLFIVVRLYTQGLVVK